MGNGDKKFGATLQKGPGGSKGDTEGPCVSLPNHCVALWGQRTRGDLGGSGEPEHRRRSYEEEGEVEEEEERR